MTILLHHRSLQKPWFNRMAIIIVWLGMDFALMHRFSFVFWIGNGLFSTVRKCKYVNRRYESCTKCRRFRLLKFVCMLIYRTTSTLNELKPEQPDRIIASCTKEEKAKSLHRQPQKSARFPPRAGGVTLVFDSDRGRRVAFHVVEFSTG